MLEAYPAIRRVADENRLILALEGAALIVAVNGATLTTASVWEHPCGPVQLTVSVSSEVPPSFRTVYFRGFTVQPAR